MYHPDILYLREQGCEDPLLFFEAKRGPRANKFGGHWPRAQKRSVQMAGASGDSACCIKCRECLGWPRNC
jgi:hypothetical protein